MKIEQLKIMLVLQNTMNKKVHPELQTQNFAWGRAIMVEAVEALEHYGWKWWKKQAPDITQVRLELVDIWHFMLSFYIQHYQEEAANYIHQQWGASGTYWRERPIQANIESLIHSGASGSVHLVAFMALLHQCNLSWEQLVKLYIGKNVLNMFRQGNGYKTGSYIKDWNGKEDNQVLMELIDANPEVTPSNLMVMLSAKYNEVAGVTL